MSPSPADCAFPAPVSAFEVTVDASTPSRINKFDGTNFHTWKFKMQMVLEERDLWDVTSGEIKLEHLTSPID